MHKLFKPLTKRDARIAAVLFGAGFLYMLYTIVKDILAGKSFDELNADIMILAFIGIIEWGMITISFSKDKKQDEEPEAALEGENEKDGSEEFAEGLSEESDAGGSDTDDADADGSGDGDAGGEAL